MVVGAQDLLDAVGARGIGPLKRYLAFFSWIAFGQIIFVGGGKETLSRIVARRKQILAHETIPLVPTIARHGQKAVPVLAHGHAARSGPADISGRVRIDKIERRRPPVIA